MPSPSPFEPTFEILPTILEPDAEQARTKLRVAETASRWIQWDVLDGTLAPNTSWHDVNAIKKWSIHAKIELDLMVKDPAAVIARWQNIHAFRRAIIHIESDVDHSALIHDLKNQGREIGLAISPGTSLMDVTPYLEFLDVIQVMGVHPGKSGQAMLPTTVDTVRALRKMDPDLTISVDGGVNAQTILPLAKAGATRFCMNSAFYTHAFPRDFLHGQLERLAHLDLY